MAKNPSTMVSGGAGYAHVDIENLIQNIEYDGDGNPVYIGWAAPGTGNDDAEWRIVKFTISGGNPTERRFASGTQSFKHVWDDRASYTYS